MSISSLEKYWNIYPRIIIDAGGEKYLPFAKNRLRDLKRRTRELGVIINEENYIIADADIYIRTMILTGMDDDLIRIRFKGSQFDRLFLYCDFGCTENLPSNIGGPCYMQVYDITYPKKKQDIYSDVVLKPSSSIFTDYEKVYMYYFYYQDAISSRQKPPPIILGEFTFEVPKHYLWGPYRSFPLANPRPSYESFSPYITGYDLQSIGDPLYLYGSWGNYSGQQIFTSWSNNNFLYLNHKLEELFQNSKIVTSILGTEGNLITLIAPGFSYSYFANAYREKRSEKIDSVRELSFTAVMDILKFISDHDTRAEKDQFIIFYKVGTYDRNREGFESVSLDQSYSLPLVKGTKTNTSINRVSDKAVSYSKAVMAFKINGSAVKEELSNLEYKDEWIFTSTSTDTISNTSPAYEWPDTTHTHTEDVVTTILKSIKGIYVDNISCQINDDFLVYTYNLMERDYLKEGIQAGSAGELIYTVKIDIIKLIKRIVGYVNIKDKRLPIGFHKKFEYLPFPEDTSPNIRITKYGEATEIKSDITILIRVAAFNPCTTSDLSNEESIHLNKGEKISYLEISWNKIEDATGYIIFINDFMWKVVMGDTKVKCSTFNSHGDRIHAYDGIIPNNPSIGVDFYERRN